MEAKFTLNEAFDILYIECLEEQLAEDIKSLTIDLNESQDQLLESLDILFEMKTGEEAHEEDDNNNHNNRKSQNDKTDFSMDNAFRSAMDMYDKMYQRAAQKVQKDYQTDLDDRFSSYRPVAQMQTVTKLTDMKFPENIIFFITQLVTWIKNNIINFIDKFSNIVRSLLGLEATKTKFKPDDLKLKLNKVKDVETKYLINVQDAYKQNPKTNFETILNTGKENKVYRKTGDLVDLGLGIAGTEYKADAVRPFSVLPVEWKDVETLREAFDVPMDLNEGKDDEKGAVKVVRLDTSKDLFALRQSLDHFFDLFDNSFGSNDEKLFSIDDLEIMLNLFKSTIKHITAGSVVAVDGDLSFGADAISATKLRDNLLRTKINTDNLKYAYVTTNKQINVLAQIIMNKNLMGASQMGASFIFLSAATYEEMIELLSIIDKRLKEAKQMEAKLQKMKKSYEKLVSTLDAGRMKLAAVKGLTYTTIIQKRVSELYDGARYMTQTIQLRLNTLALYISELNDTRAILKNLNAIPEASYKSHDNVFKKFKKLFDK